MSWFYWAGMVFLALWAAHLTARNRQLNRKLEDVYERLAANQPITIRVTEAFARKETKV